MRKRKVRTECEKQHRALRRFAALVALILLCVCQAGASTQTWDITASLFCGFLDPCSAPFTLTATMTTQTETGLFYEEFEGGTFPGTFPVETGISGEFNGAPISFPGLIQADGIFGYLYLPSVPQGIVFEADGVPYFFNYDGSIQIFPANIADEASPFNGEHANWTAIDPVDVSESPLLPMALAGVVMALWMKRRSMAGI